MPTEPFRALSAFVRDQDVPTLRRWLDDHGRSADGRMVVGVADSGGFRDVPVSVIESELVARSRCD